MSKKLPQRQGNEDEDNSARRISNFNPTAAAIGEDYKSGASGDYDDDKKKSNVRTISTNNIGIGVEIYNEDLYIADDRYINNLNDIRKTLNMADVDEMTQFGKAQIGSPSIAVDGEVALKYNLMNHASNRIIEFESNVLVPNPVAQDISNTFIQVDQNVSDVFLGSSINETTKSQGFYKIEHKELIKTGSMCSWSADLSNQMKNLISIRDSEDINKITVKYQNDIKKNLDRTLPLSGKIRLNCGNCNSQSKFKIEVTPRTKLLPPKRPKYEEKCISPPIGFSRTISTQFDMDDITTKNYVSAAGALPTKFENNSIDSNYMRKSFTDQKDGIITSKTNCENITTAKNVGIYKKIHNYKSYEQNFGNCAIFESKHDEKNDINTSFNTNFYNQFENDRKAVEVSKIPGVNKICSCSLTEDNQRKHRNSLKSELTYDMPDITSNNQQQINDSKRIKELHFCSSLQTTDDSRDSEFVVFKNETFNSTHEESHCSCTSLLISENIGHIFSIQQHRSKVRKRNQKTIFKCKSADSGYTKENKINFQSDTLIIRRNGSAFTKSNCNWRSIGTSRCLKSASSEGSSIMTPYCSDEDMSENALSLRLNLPSSICEDDESLSSPLEPNIIFLGDQKKKTKKKKKKQSIRFDEVVPNVKCLLEKYYRKTPNISNNTTPSYIVSPVFSENYKNMFAHPNLTSPSDSLKLYERSEFDSNRSDSKQSKEIPKENKTQPVSNIITNIEDTDADERSINTENKIEQKPNFEPNCVQSIMKDIISEDFRSYISELSANNDIPNVTNEFPIENKNSSFDSFKNVGSTLLSNQNKMVIKPTKEAKRKAKEFLNTPTSPSIRIREFQEGKNKLISHRQLQHVDLSYYSLSSVDDIQESEDDKSVEKEVPTKKTSSCFSRILSIIFCFWRPRNQEMWISDKNARVYRHKHKRNQLCDKKEHTRQLNSKFCDIENIPTTSFGEQSEQNKIPLKGEALKLYMHNTFDSTFLSTNRLEKRNKPKIRECREVSLKAPCIDSDQKQLTTEIGSKKKSKTKILRAK